MKYLAAYLLLQLGGNASPSASDIKSLLAVVDSSVDEERLSKLLADLEGKDIAELQTEGLSKLASVPSGGVAVASGGAVAAGGAAAEEEKEKEEEKEESDEDMGFGLFD